jgi:predicted SnoaL-like aldol condensation-catalyzing enzyme
MQKPLVRTLALLVGVASCSGTAQERTPASPTGTKETAMSVRNKQLVRTALQELFGNRDPGALSRYWAEPYRQHNPHVPDGLAALPPLLEQLESYDVKRVLGEGELVVTHSLARGLGPTPMVVFDIFLVRDERLVEHWDVMQPLAERTVSGRTQLDGPTEPAGPADPARTAASKEVVQGFLEQVIYGHQLAKLPTFINPAKYHQHNPMVGDGLDGFGAAMAQLAKQGLKMEYRKTYRIIADGDLVFTHSEGEFAGRHVAFADLFRVEDGKIVEHWDCIQDVVDPAATANRHGMFAQLTP